MNGTQQLLDADLDGLELGDLDFEAVEISTVRDAVALPETGASSVLSSCDSCSSCGSSSCCPST